MKKLEVLEAFEKVLTLDNVDGFESANPFDQTMALGLIEVLGFDSAASGKVEIYVPLPSPHCWSSSSHFAYDAHTPKPEFLSSSSQFPWITFPILRLIFSDCFHLDARQQVLPVFADHLRIPSANHRHILELRFRLLQQPQSETTPPPLLNDKIIVCWYPERLINAIELWTNIS